MRQRSLIEEYLKGIRRLERAVKRINQIKTPEAIIKNVLKECNNILKSSSCALVLKKEKNLWDAFVYKKGRKTLKNDTIVSIEKPDIVPLFPGRGLFIREISINIDDKDTGYFYGAFDNRETLEHAEKFIFSIIETILISALSRIELLKEVNFAHRHLKIVYDMSQSIISTTGFDKLIDKLFKEIQQHFGYENMVLFVREDDETMILRYSTRPLLGHIGLRFRIGKDGIVGHVAKTGKPYYAPDVWEDPYYRIGKFPARSEFSIPLVLEGKVIGVIDIESTKPNGFPSETREILSALAANIAVAMERARLYEETERLSIMDPLTGVSNRRLLEKMLQNAIDRSARYNRKFAVLFIDFDNFKPFNDKYGHAEGDKVLISHAQVISEHLRKSDTIGRYGGDEFIVILYNASRKYAEKVANRILNSIAKSRYREVTVSIGVSVYPEDGENVEDLIRSADAACYKAKKFGGQRVDFA